MRPDIDGQIIPSMDAVVESPNEEQPALPLPEEQPTVPLWPTVGRLFHLGRTATFEAHKRGEFPFPVWRIGGRLVAPTASVRRELRLDP